MDFGADVSSSLGDVVGTVERVVMDLDTNEVLEYIVHKTVGLVGDVVVPNGVVSNTTNDALVLSIPTSAVEGLPDYVHSKFGARLHPPGAPLPGIGAGPPAPTAPVRAAPKSVEISGKTRLECEDGQIGNVEGVVVDEMTSEITDLIVEVRALRRKVRVPMAWTSSLQNEVIRLQCVRADIEGLAS